MNFGSQTRNYQRRSVMEAAAMTIKHDGIEILIVPKNGTPQKAAAVMCKLLAMLAMPEKSAADAPQPIGKTAEPKQVGEQFPTDGLVSASQICQFIKKSRTTLDVLRRKGEFPEPINRGGGYPRWHAKTVRDWAS